MKENDIGQLVNALSNKELIVRVDLNKSLKVSKFKLGSLEMKGELGISFRDIKEEPIEVKEEKEEEKNEIEEADEKKDKGEVKREKEEESESENTIITEDHSEEKLETKIQKL